MVAAISQLLWPHQRAFKQVCMVSFDKMQFLVILLKDVMVVMLIGSFQQYIRLLWSSTGRTVFSSQMNAAV